MRVRLMYVIALVLGLGACEQEPEAPVRWTRYTSAAAGFEVEIPEPYTLFEDRSEHAFGEHKAFAVCWRKPESSLSRLGFKLLSAGYFEIPELRRYPAAYVLDSFVQAEAAMDAVKNGRVLDLSPDSVQGHPARCLRTMIDNGKSDSLYCCEQFILVGTRMYHLRANGYKAVLDTPAMRYFMESFRLL